MKKALLWMIGSFTVIALVLQGLFLLFLFLTFGRIGQTTVVQTLPSPDGTYEARVIDHDQGALGGDTMVEVERNGLFTRPKRVYMGEWGEYKTMEIYWKNDTCLVINGKEYLLE